LRDKEQSKSIQSSISATKKSTEDFNSINHTQDKSFYSQAFSNAEKKGHFICESDI
jgi:hypothetical protein